MANRYVAICLSVGCLLMLVGCTSPAAGPEAAWPAIVRPPATPRDPNAAEAAEAAEAAQREPEAGEPNDIAKPVQIPVDMAVGTDANGLDADDIPTEELAAQEQSSDSNTVEIAKPDAVEAAEPNDVDLGAADPSEVIPPEPAAEPNEAPPGEPNKPAAGEPRTEAAVEPNEAPPSEPNVPAVARAEPQRQEPVVQGQAAALPRFVERYASILQEYVRKDGRVDYGALRRKRVQLKQLLMRLDDLEPDVYAAWAPEAKLAFWLNAYNLKMLETITRNYPIESSWWLRLTWPPSDIRHIKDIWTDYKFIVMDEEFTLAEVERRLFRKTFDDPRVYLAVTYATRSSPRLRRRPYSGAKLEQQLDEQVNDFLSDPQGLRIDRRNKTVYLSALFKPSWRGKEFVARYGTDKKFKDRQPETRAVLSFLTKYLDREEVYFLETENYALEYMNFDWRINDTARGF